jgi:hypothetical protein
MIKKLVLIGMILLLVGVVCADQQSDIGMGQNVRAWTTKWTDKGVIVIESQQITAVPLCEDNSVAYIYESDIAPVDTGMVNQWTFPNPTTFQQTQVVPYSHSENMVIITDNATVQKYCNPVPRPVLH